MIFRKSLGNFQPSDIVMVYKFIHDHATLFTVQKQCQMLSISKSGYYDWLKGKSHQPSDVKIQLHQQIIDTFQEHRSRYGSRRIAATLQQQGVEVSRQLVGRVLGSMVSKLSSPGALCRAPPTADTSILSVQICCWSGLYPTSPMKYGWETSLTSLWPQASGPTCRYGWICIQERWLAGS